MNKFFRRVIKFFAYFAGGVVILLAIAVGLFRLFLPRLPEYQEDIKSWASAAIGMQVEFSGMDARWGLSGPEVEFYNAELISLETQARLVMAEQVSVGVALSRLLFDRTAVVDRVVVSDTSIEVRQLANGQWWVQGGPIDDLLPQRPNAGATPGGGLGPIEIVGEDIEVLFLQPGDERPTSFLVQRLVLSSDNTRIAVDADIDLPERLGSSLAVTATQLLSQPASARSWDVSVEADDIRLAGVTAMQPVEAARFDSGRGDVEVSLRYADKRVQSATAELEIGNISIAGLADLALSGRLEFLGDADGWLIAANDFQATTPVGEWPVSSARLEVNTNTDGEVVSIDARASYLNFDHIAVSEPWLTEQQRAMLRDFDPSGMLRDLSIAASDLDKDEPSFSVSAEMINVGVAATDTRPGVRGFSGTLRADQSSGRLEIDSDSLVVTAGKLLGRPLQFDTTLGTIIWRRSNDRTTVLSDSIVLQNEFFDSETSVEVSLDNNSAAPFVDLESTFSIDDVSKARVYVPFMPQRPRMSQWFQEGLVSGRIPRGRATLHGPMDKWPFDNDEGQLLIEGNVRDAVIVYQPKWPAANVIDADIKVENMSLSSERSHIINAGNEIIDAKLEIADFRNPHLTISGVAGGTLESLRQLSIQSPIAEMFGGQLERITVSGDAVMSLDMNVPIRDWENFTFKAALRPENGSFQIEGFNAPLQELNGTVIIEREDINSESLTGLFLGRPVAIELSQAPESMPKYRVIADAQGTATAQGLVEELGLPLSGRVTGAADFSAQLFFPRGNMDDPAAFRIELASDLAGIAVDMPQPLRKPLDETIAFTAVVTMPKDSEIVSSTGKAGDVLAWQVDFTKQQDKWDMDRGIVTFGGEGVTMDAPDTRGLHFRGSTDYVHVQRWFDMAREAHSKTGFVDRIRSIDMTVGNLHMLGQHLVDHRVQLDRSARDWLIQVEGEDIVGSAFVPYDLNSERAIVVEAERLVLPGDDVDATEPATKIDPRDLPSISFRSKETAFGSRFFGAVEADFIRTADGLESERIIATDETFEIVGNGKWVIDETDPEGHRSYITATLTSEDVKKTMERLDYQPGIIGDDLSMLLDLSWSGGPRDDMLEWLDGEVKLRIGQGQLEEVKPGAGRVFGLLSIAALPRRLSLDFRDVFGRGFGFDKIQGTFTLVDGDTYTCDLSLESPAADIGIVGRAGLVSRDYEQTAVVSASFGNALPVAGALVAGPQVAAALLIFSQIFKKPLQEVSQVYYGIGGSWDDPKIESATAEIFALSGAMTGCIEEEE